MFKTDKDGNIMMKCLLCDYISKEQDFWVVEDGEKIEECPKCQYMGIGPAEYKEVRV